MCCSSLLGMGVLFEAEQLNVILCFCWKGNVNISILLLPVRTLRHCKIGWTHLFKVSQLISNSWRQNTVTSELWFCILSVQKEGDKRRVKGGKEQGVRGKGRRGNEGGGKNVACCVYYPPFAMFSTAIHYCFQFYNYFLKLIFCIFPILQLRKLTSRKLYSSL